MAAPTLKQIRMMHIVNLMSIAYADGKISEEESNILGNIAEKWELTDEEFNVCIEHWKQTDEKDIPIAVPEDEDEQMAYLKDFTLMMMIDGEIEDNEKQYLAHVAAQFGYNPEEAVPALIDMVYQEYFAESNEEEDDDEDEEEESFFQTSDEDKIESAKFDLESKHFEDAFDGLFKLALTNPEAYDYFHILPGIDTRLFHMTEEQLELVQKKAKKYAVAQYVLGRYHQVVKPDEDSLDKATELLKSAAEAGISDAQWALATMYLYGYDGPVDYAHYQELLSQASKNGSAMALRQRLLDLTNGEHGLEAEPKKVISIITDYLESDENNPSKYPYLYAVMGDAYRKVGNKEGANECYEKADEHGYFESEADKFLNHIEGPDKDFYRVNFSMLLDFGCDANNPGCFLQRGLERAYHYTQKDEESAGIAPEQIKEDLEKAFELGNGEAAYYLGQYYYTGDCGFEQDNEEALDWFYKGINLENGPSFAGLARMIEDGNDPDDATEGFVEVCQLNALRRGDKTMLLPVIEAFKDGKLVSFANEIEQCYLPMLNQNQGTSKMSMVAVIHPDGTATAYKFEKEEWLKLPHLIGAKRLMPLRVDGLEQIGKQAGLTDHLVGWIDLDAPRKGLPFNPVAAKFFDGVIAGDIAVSLADKLYDPVPFYGLEEAQVALDALGVTLKETITDLSAVSDARPAQMDYSKLNPDADKGYLARIEPDGKAIIMSSGLQMFALFEEDIYDPARLQKLYDLGQQLGLKGRLTIWTNNAELRKILLFPGTAFPCHHPIGEQLYPGAVVDNFFVAMEDEKYRIMLFDDVETLKKVCIAMGVKPEDITIQ